MPPPPRLKQFFYLTSVCLSDVFLSLCRVHRAYGKSRTEKPRKTKIATDVAHITHDSDTIFKVKRSKDKVTGAGAYCGGLLHSLLFTELFTKVVHFTNSSYSPKLTINLSQWPTANIHITQLCKLVPCSFNSGWWLRCRNLVTTSTMAQCCPAK